MTSMQDIFEIIGKYHMIEPGMRVIAGVSGGADSVCLLYMLSRFREQVPFGLMAVHVEHGIRGAESLEDAAFTEHLCEHLDVPCRVIFTPVQQIAKERGLSVEEAGRTERYRIFEEVRREWNADRIAVAHNQNDQAETVIWNLVRGSGAKGLGGIRPVRDRIIRPLLFTGRKEIEQILLDAGLAWRTDCTNLTQDYTRNRIRLSLLPQMEQELNAGAVEHIAQAAGRLQQMQEFVERMTQEAAERCLTVEHAAENAAGQCRTGEHAAENAAGQCRAGEHAAENTAEQCRAAVILRLASFWKEDELIRTELLKKALKLCRGGRGLKDIGSVHIEMLHELAGMDCGKECHLPGKIRAVREDGILRLTIQQTEKMQKPCTDQQNNPPGLSEKSPGESTGGSGKTVSDVSSYILPIPGVLDIPGWHIETELLENSSSVQEQIQGEKKYTKWLSYDIINSDVLLRTRQTGDYLAVGAQGGRKKLKDYFIDLKIPREKRDQIWLLADGSHILWTVGYRISEQAKVRFETKRVVKIQMEEKT